MLGSLKEIFATGEIVTNENGDRIKLHSHTSEKQGLFLQEMFDIAKPKRSLEVGFAYGISTMFILEKHKELNNDDFAHLAIEPDKYWGGAALFNINNEGLSNLLQIEYDYSDKILPKLFIAGHNIQFAYIDTTKRFDVIMTDFYFIDKIMDVNGIVVLDDCFWPGVKKVVRYINSLPNYEVVGKFQQLTESKKKKVLRTFYEFVLKILPFKKKLFPEKDFCSSEVLKLNYQCIAFKKNAVDERNWDWDAPI